MAGRQRFTWMEAGGWFCMCVLFVAALFVFAGCPGGGSSGPSRPDTHAGELGEAELLAELDRKFQNPTAHYRLGRVYHRTRQWAKAEYHYSIALGFDPAHRPTQAAMVKMLIERGDAASGENYARSYIGQVKESTAQLLLLGEAFDSEGLDEYALTCFTDAQERAPDSAGVNRALGFYYLGNGDRVRAKEYLVKSFELNPNQADVSHALGRLGVSVELPREPADK